MNVGKRKNINERLAEKQGIYSAIVEISVEIARGTTKKTKGILIAILAAGATFLGLAKMDAEWWMAAMALFVFTVAILLIANERLSGSSKNKSNWSG